jgi:hypothetical protein
MRRFSEADESEGREEETFMGRDRERILEVVLPEVRKATSPRAWACFEGRMMERRPAANLRAELGITANAVYVYASLVLRKVRRRYKEIEDELGGDDDLDPP